MLKVIGIWNLRVRIWKFLFCYVFQIFLNFPNGVNKEVYKESISYMASILILHPQYLTTQIVLNFPGK